MRRVGLVFFAGVLMAVMFVATVAPVFAAPRDDPGKSDKCTGEGCEWKTYQYGYGKGGKPANT
jgi:hypothetical protein